jgi:hypothetical protein
MMPFIIAFISLVLLLGLYSFIGLPLGSRGRRGAISVFFALLIAGLFFGYSDMLGRPKSARLEVLRGGDAEATVLGSYAVEGSGIYLWVLLPRTHEPRYYVLPWDQTTATSLQKAVEDNEKQHGGGVVARLPFERSWDVREPEFHALPQPKLPDKDTHPSRTMTYSAPEQQT